MLASLGQQQTFRLYQPAAAMQVQCHGLNQNKRALSPCADTADKISAVLVQ